MREFTNQKGFNLIELLVAMAILLTGTLAVASMLMTSSTNSLISNQDRGGDAIALEIVEAVRGGVVEMTLKDLGLEDLTTLSSGLRLQKPLPGKDPAAGPYQFQDRNEVTKGTAASTGIFVQRVGKYYSGSAGGTDPSLNASSYIYRWRLSNVQNDYSLPIRTLKLEVTVGWNDKKYEGRFPCTGDPGDPGAPNRNCARCTKMTSWVTSAKN